MRATAASPSLPAPLTQKMLGPCELAFGLGKAFCALGRGTRCSARFTSSPKRRWAGRPMTTRLEVGRLSTPRRTEQGALSGRGGFWGIYRSASSYTPLRPPRLALDGSDAAGAFVEPAEATPLRQREGSAGLPVSLLAGSSVPARRIHATPSSSPAPSRSFGHGPKAVLGPEQPAIFLRAGTERVAVR